MSKATMKVQDWVGFFCVTLTFLILEMLVSRVDWPAGAFRIQMKNCFSCPLFTVICSSLGVPEFVLIV